MLPQEIFALAQQGHPIAIGTLLNYSIRSQGIKARVQRQEQGLHVLLESRQALDPEKTIAFVKGSVSVLNVDSIRTIMVYSRRQGKTHLDWWQTIELHSASEPSSANLPLLNWVNLNLVNLPLFPASLPDLSLSNPADLPLSRRDAVTQDKTQDNIFSESLETAHSAAIESPTPFLIEEQIEAQTQEQIEAQSASSAQQSALVGRSSEELPVGFNSASASPFSTPVDLPAEASQVLKRPESVIFLLFITLFIFWDAYIEFLDDDYSLDTTAVSASQLARRLKVSRKVIRRRKRDRDFLTWTKSLDPDGMGWTYRKGYYLSQP